jgi:ectoine hydroxylase-related dioxygenase (phytanoyl-CoA dioxygenase family)
MSQSKVDDDCDDHAGEMESADEALCDMLGIKSMVKCIEEEDEQNHDDETPTVASIDCAAALRHNIQYSETRRPTLQYLLSLSDAALQDLITNNASGIDLRDVYRRDRVVYFPQALCVPAAWMRRITEEVVWSSSSSSSSNSISCSGCADKTYETIRVIRKRHPRPIGDDEKQEDPTSSSSSPKHGHADAEHKHEDSCHDDVNEDDDNVDNVDFVVYQERQCLTRLENFCRHHAEWNQLCSYIGRVLSILCDGTEMSLYKEKLNLKPPGGSGFAPHLDTPSLLVALQQQQTQRHQQTQQQPDAVNGDNTAETPSGAGAEGPTSFVTVMVAIDDMNDTNGCLRVVKGPWTAANAVATIAPEENGNPDANGRAGAIPHSVAETLHFESLPCKGGTIVVFDGHVPHRSAANTSPFARRAVFLTYNPRAQGDFHDLYYQRMQNLRNEWRRNVGLPTEDEQVELQALSTIPK